MRLLFALSCLAILLASACGSGAPDPSPAEIDRDILATIVAATLESLGAGGVVEEEELETEEPSSSPSLLPHSLYFLSTSSGSAQVWRLEQDGVTLSQVTATDDEVSGYDVSHTDGSVAYVSENRLFLVSADGSEQRLLVDASGADSASDDYYYRYQISSPRFSPDGTTLAYALNGINLLDMETGESRHVLSNILEELGSGAVMPGELYFPEKWSPDGEILLVAIGYLEGGSLAFLDTTSGNLTTISATGIVCCQSQWAPDSGSILVASPYLGLVEPGLWRYDADTGAESVVVIGSTPEATFNFVGWPLQLGSGELYYFFSSTAGIPEGDVPLLMMRSAADGIDDRSPLRADSFVVREALWASDGSLALVVQSLQGPSGPVVLARSDGSALQVLLNEVQQLRWGP